MADFTTMMRKTQEKKTPCPEMYECEDGTYSCKAKDDSLICPYLSVDTIECDVTP